ncbi:MAG: hypothetical protein O7J95_01255 [Planctomycetota bacterium]|nr:hypothetical protein [Planctomycetota bacterium]
MRRLVMALVAGLLGVPAPGARAADTLIHRGNAAYGRGDFAAAVELYESTDNREDTLARRFNAGVALLRQEKLEDAMSRFEDVSSRARGDLQRRAYTNLGYCHFQVGFARSSQAFAAEGVRQAFETEEIDDATLETLLGEAREAVASYRSALDFFRKVYPPDDDSRHNVAVTKIAILDVVDRFNRLEEMKKRREEEAALEEPAELLRTLVAKENLHRGLARSQSKAGGGKTRIVARRLGKAEEENRALTERLLHHLRREPAEGEEPLPDEEKQRREKAAGVIARGVEAQKQAVASYARRGLEEAATHHTTAIRELRAARVFFPIQLPRLVEEAIATQKVVLEGSRAIEREQTGGLGSGETKGSGFGRMIIGALKDKVLRPLARKLAPPRGEEMRQLAEEEDEVAWAGGIISQAEIPPTPQGAAPGGPGAGHGQPQLDEAEAKALSEKVREEGAIARDAATGARGALERSEIEAAVPSEENALAALERVADLLPKPPESPEEKLRRLIERQKTAGDAAEGMAELEKEALEEAARELAGGQRSDGEVAGEIATELEGREQDERARKATPRVREGEEHVFASAEAFGRGQPREGRGSIEQAVEALEEALALLSGQQPQRDEGDPEKNQEQDERDQRGEGQRDPKESQGSYALTPRQARMLKEQMDKKRREEEAKVLFSRSSITVDKDW